MPQCFQPKPLPLSLLSILFVGMPTWSSINTSPLVAVSCNMTGKGGITCPPKTASNTQSNSPSAARGVGNPIDVLSGNKFEHAQDISVHGDEYALNLNRYYNSQAVQIGIFGVGWRSDYEMQLKDEGERIQILAADGSIHFFYKKNITDPTNGLITPRYQHTDPSLGYVIQTGKTTAGDALWYWHLPDGRRISFTNHKLLHNVNTDGKPEYGQLLTIHANPNQQGSPYWQLRYDTHGRLAQVSNHTGATLKFTYHTTPQGNSSITVTTSEGAAYQYFLDKHKNLSQVVNAAGKRIGYAYKDKYDKHNLTAKYHYDDAGQAHLISQWTYDKLDRATSSSLADNIEKITISYDENASYPMPQGHIYTNTLTNSLGEVTHYRYNITHHKLRLLSAMGAGCGSCGQTNVSYTYDDIGRVTSITHYDDTGNILNTQHVHYDDLGRIASTSHDTPEEAPKQISYRYVSDDPNHPLHSRISEQSWSSVYQGKQTGYRYEYNDKGQLIAKIQFGYTPDGTAIERRVILSYTEQGLPSTVSEQHADTLITTIRYTWDDLGNLVHLEEPIIGRVTTFEYDQAGNTTSLNHIAHTDATPIRFLITYDAKNRPISLMREEGKRRDGVRYHYDPLDNISTVTDMTGKTLNQYTFDTANRLIASIGRYHGSLIHLDSESRPIAHYMASPKGVDKIQRVLPTANTAPRTSQALIRASLPKPQVTRQPEDQTIFGTQATPYTTLSQGILRVHQAELTTTYQLDDFGRIAVITHPAAGTHRYTYDSRDKLTTIQLADGRIIRYTYDAKGLRTSKTTLEHGKPTATVTWIYDNKGRLITQSEEVQRLDYHYDEQGRITTKTLTIAGLPTPLGNTL